MKDHGSGDLGGARSDVIDFSSFFFFLFWWHSLAFFFWESENRFFVDRMLGIMMSHGRAVCYCFFPFG